MKKIIRYYSDERNDDFAGTDILQKDLPENFRYIWRCPAARALTFIVYRLLVTPLIWAFMKLVFGHRTVNRGVLRRARGGYFLYGNHTNTAMDAYIPTLLAFPRKAYIIVNPDATSIPGIRGLLMMLGALPLAGNLKLTKRFLEAVSERSEKGAVTVYPEAHIWPYYTDVRDFNPASLAYAYMNNRPVYCFTNIYVKRKKGAFPRVVTYVDGPFLPDMSKTKRENVAALKEAVYGAMKARIAANPKYEYRYSYVKADR